MILRRSKNVLVLLILSFFIFQGTVKHFIKQFTFNHQLKVSSLIAIAYGKIVLSLLNFIEIYELERLAFKSLKFLMLLGN